MHFNKTLIGRSFIGCWLVCSSITADAANFSKAELDDEQFLLLDVKNTRLSFLQGIDAYGVEGQVLLPIAALLQALEMNFVVSTENATIKLTKNNVVFDIDLANQTEQGPLTDNAEPFFWSNEEDELLVSHLLIEQLLDATLNFNTSLLAVTVENAKAPFPIEQRLLREDRRQKAIRPQQEANRDDLNKIVFADEFILDTYQLASTPYLYSNLVVTSNGNQNSETKISNSLQSNFDLLYHNTSLTLNKQSNNDIATNLTFNRHQGSPYETFPLGIQHYSFGDVSGKADNLTVSNQAGIGLSVSRRPVNYSRKFGTVTLEDTAPPGWEMELYRGGVLLATATVPADGRYVFEDVETRYGVNKFEIKLYGPYGEEDVHHKNIRINGTQLKADEYGFNSYILDAGNKLLNGINGQSDSFKPDTFGFAWDYGLGDNLSLGLNLTQTENGNNNTQQFVGTEIQTSIPGALFDFSLSHEIGEGYAALAAVSGRLWDTTTYQLNYSTSKNYQLQNSNPDQDFFSASMNGRLLKVSFNNSFSYTKGNLNDSINVANRLAGRIGKLNLTHNLNYRDIQPKFRPNAANIETFTGDVSISGRLSQDSRIAGGFTYDIKDKAKISLFRLSTGMRLSKKINFNSQIDYKPQSTVKWRVNNSLSWSSKKATFYSSLSYDADDQWAVSLGLTFSLGYDEHQDDWLFSSQNIIAGGTMDINSYLDQNNNHQLDEGDLALPGVKYGHLKQWEGISSNDQGRVSLPFVSSYSPTLISPSSTFGVTPSTSSYAVYTHPGSRIKAQIPFTVRTSVSGFVLLTDEDGDPLTNTNVFLNNVKGKTIDQTDTDDDGYFEFNNVRPGNYTVLVDPTALGSRTLRSDPGSLQFNTMPAGGFLELGVLAAVPASQNVSESTRVVKATIDNYEPLEDVEKLLGIRTFASDAGDTTIAGPSPSDISTTTRPDNFAETDNAADNISSPNPLIPVSTQVLQSASVLAPQAAAPVPQLKRSSVQSPSAATLPNAGSGFALQFGVYSTASLTNDLIKTLKNSGINALSYFDKQIMGYRVLVGPFNSQAQARLKSSEIKGRGFDNFTRSWPAQVSPPAKSSSTSSTQANSASGIPAALPEKGFAIQMMVAQSQKSIDDITSNNRLGNDLYQIKKAHQGGTLNVLLKGHYLTRVQAQQAISGLPAQWRSKTWIRPVGDLRAEQVN